MIETSKLVCMGVSAAVGLLVPLALLLYWRKKTHASPLMALIGAATFLVFAYGLENLLHMVCLYGDNAVSRFLAATPWAYYLYGGLAAGLFEETGRFLAFYLFRKKFRAPCNGVMYGVGHGGVESLLVCTLSMVTMLTMALSVNAIGADAFLASGGEAGREGLTDMLATLTNTPATSFLASGFERISALVLHIGLSVLVFASVHAPGKRYLFPAAILAHAAVDFIALALFRSGVVTSVALMEGVVFLMGAIVAVWAFFVYRGLSRAWAYAASDAAAATADAGDAPSAPEA